MLRATAVGIEGTHHRRRSQHRLIELAESLLSQQSAAAGFVVGEDGAEDRLHVTAHPAAVVVEDLGNAIDVGRAWVRADQLLNQLPTDKRPDVRVIEQSVDRLLQIDIAILIGGKGHTIQNGFGAGLVTRGDESHRIIDIRRRLIGDRPGLIVVPTGQHAGHADHCILVVGGTGQPVDVQLESTIGLQKIHTHTEQLHDFTGIVLIGHGAGGRVGLHVASHGQKQSHAGVEGHVYQHIAIISESIFGQCIVVSSHAEELRVKIGTIHRHDEDLVQGEGDALPELIRGDAGHRPPGTPQLIFVDRLTLGLPACQKVKHTRLRLGKLVVEPSVVPVRLHIGDVIHGRPIAGLSEKAGGILLSRRATRKRRGRGRRHKHL